MKKAVFILQEATKDGIDGYIVKGWENVLKASGLPTEYFNFPLFYQDINNDIFISTNCGYISFGQGDFKSKSEWQEIYNLMLQAGHRLSKILEEQRKPKVIRFEI